MRGSGISNGTLFCFSGVVMPKEKDVAKYMGYIVVGAFGHMALSGRKEGLFFGKRRDTVATVFPSRSTALAAISTTERKRKLDYPDEVPWLNMRVVRLMDAK